MPEEDALRAAVDRAYRVFAGYQAEGELRFCSYCHGPEEIEYFRRTPLREFDPEHARQLLWESADHWPGADVYRRYLPLLLDSLAFALGEDMYPGHLVETVEALGFAGWPAAERRAVTEVLEAYLGRLSVADAEEWRRAVARLRC